MTSYTALLDQSTQPQTMWRASNEITEKEAKYWKITLTVLGIFFLLAAIGGTIACCKTQLTCTDNLGKVYALSNAMLCPIPLSGVFAAGMLFVLAIAIHKDSKTNQRRYKTDEEVAAAKKVLLDPKTNLSKAHEGLGKAVRSKIVTEEEGEVIEDNLKHLEEAESVLSSYSSSEKKCILSGNAPERSEEKQKIEQALATITRVNDEWKELQEKWEKLWGLKST